MMRTRIIGCIAVGFIGLSVYSQAPVIKASIDSAQIQIGEQTWLHLEIAANQDESLQLPLVTDTLMRGVEVLEISPLDTVDLGNRRMQIQYDYLITSFDSALYMLPPFKIIAGTDTFYSNQVALKVSTLPVDTESGIFYDIKDIWKPRFVLTDYADVFCYVLAACAVIFLVIYILFRRKKRQPILPFTKEEIMALPPHVRAIQALDAIKSEKLWQQGKDKEYHSQLSNVIRGYIEESFEIRAMEMTSGETLQAMRGNSKADLVFAQLKQLLLLSDLAKFAKYRPAPDENELSLMNAYLFVNGTTPIPEAEEKADEENENEDPVNAQIK
jgi:hypothetical protein